MNEYHGIIVVCLYQTLDKNYVSIKKLGSKILGRTWKGRRWKSCAVVEVVKTSNFYFVN